MPRQAYNTISRLDKERLREVYRNGGDFLNLATQLNISRTTAYNIVRREVVEKKRGGKTFVIQMIHSEHSNRTIGDSN